MTDKASLRRQLTKIRDRTANAIGAGGWWVGDFAGERQDLDDLAAGRLAWREAHYSAEAGLTALDAGNIEMAEVCLTNAIWLYIDALERWVRPADIKKLSRPARRRGRPRKAE